MRTVAMTFAKFSKKFHFDLSLKRRVVAIGTLHAVLLVYGLVEVIFNTISEQQPVTEADIFYILFHVLLHVFLFASLVSGALSGKAVWLLPWLVVNLPIFAVISYYVLKYSRFSYLSQLIFNVVFLSFGWYLWFTVLQFYHLCKNVNWHGSKM